MIKKLIFLNVLIISVLMLSGCGTPINVQLPSVEVSGGDPSGPIIIDPIDPITIDPGDPAPAPEQGVFNNNLLIYIVVGLVLIIALIALVAVASKNSNSSSSSS
jgi:hypothetical protein